MKKILFCYFGLALFLVVIPVLSVLIFGKNFKYENDNEITVYIKNEDRTEIMDKEDYIKGVVAAEMPVEFETEALKAQAVAARTYLEKKIANSEKSAHTDAVICTDHTCCQAWISEDARKESWETDKKDEYWNKICIATDETRGEILMYDNSVISALFHSTSSGNTENAEDVWGESVPYLVSVKSEQDENSPKFHDEKKFEITEFKNKIAEAYSDTDTEKPLFENIERSDSGGIKTLTVCGIQLKGTELRTLFDLRSTNMDFFCNDESILIKTKGYGHGVGMSQYGANFMAKEGKNYRDILLHYYKNTYITKQ